MRGLLQSGGQRSCADVDRNLLPPYGKTIGLWLSKARAAALAGATVVALIPARTDTKWWHGIVEPRASFDICQAACVSADATIPAPFPSVVVIWRPSVDTLA
jgi:hypothetical protein